MASADYQHVSGKFNVASANSNDLFIIGNGTSAGSRSNIVVVNTSSVIVGGNISASGTMSCNHFLTSNGTFQLTSPYLGALNVTSQQLSQSAVISMTTADGKNAGLAHYSAGHVKGQLLDIFAQPGLQMSLSPNGSEAVRINTVGNVGIGNTASLSKLGVTGNASIGATYGVIAAPTSGMIIEGNVGIGTASPLGKLDVKTTSGNLSYFGTGITSTATQYSGIALGYGEAGPTFIKSAIVQEQTGDAHARGKIHILNTNAGGSTNVGLSDARLTIQADGNVGIGTTSPNTKLEVNGTFRAGNANDTYMTYDSAADNITLRKGSYYTSFGFDDANGFTPTIGFSGGPSQLIIRAGSLYVKPTAAAGLVNAIKLENTTGTSNVSATGISLRAGGNVAKGLIAFTNQTAWGVGDLTFGINSSANNTEAGLADAHMTIQGSTGNVGIGTTSPLANLDVGASAGTQLFYNNLTTILSTTPILRVSSNNASNATQAQIGISLSNTSATNNTYSPVLAFSRRSTSGTYNTAYAEIAGIATGDGASADWVKGVLTFLTAPVGNIGPIERMRIDEAGYVGIGTPNPSHQLTLSTDSAAKPSSNVWTITSDERIKTDIVPADLDRCYDIVKQVGLKHFGFKPGVYSDEQINDKHSLGWIAQDVQKVFGKAVSIKPFTLQTDIPDGTEEYEEQEFTVETVNKVETSIQVINGKPVQVSKVVTSENKVMLFDMVDVLDEAGAAVMESYEVTPAIAAIDATEEVEAVESIEAVMGTRPVTYKMPRMITKTRPKVRREVIEDCLDLNGGQMNAALYGAVQCLMAKVEAQAVTIAALQTKVGE